LVPEKIVWLSEVDSTMNWARDNLSTLPVNRCVVVAEVQHQGRGQRGRQFVSGPGGLYISMPLKPKIKEGWDEALIRSLSVHTKTWLESEYGIMSHIKPPNDLLVGNAKIMGVLIETVYLGNELQSLILGAGLNVSQKFKEEEYPFEAVSIAEIVKIDLNPRQVLSSWLLNWNPWSEGLL